MNSPVQRICVLCQQPASLTEDEIDPDAVKEFTHEACPRCKNWMQDGHYIFVSISDKSEPPAKINRTGYTWEVEGPEVREQLGEDHEIVQSPQNVVFVRHKEALELGLLTREEYDELRPPEERPPEQ